MIRYEWKKLLFRRKGLLLIVLFLIVELASVLLFTQPYDAVLENNRAVYENYLSRVEGSLTEEKRNFLESEMERLNDIHQKLEQLKQDYYSGAVTEEEYRNSFDLLASEDAKYTGFSKLYSQYIFVRESNQRSFLYTGGWEVLLTDQEPDYLFLLVLIVLLVPMFCEEYACRMHEILLTQKRSARFQVPAKVVVALSLTFVLTTILQLVDLIYCAAGFGLPNGAFSLQSVYSFGTTAKQMTLWQAFGLQFALKVLGYFYAAVVILFLSVLLKKFALTLMAGIAILPLPFLTVIGTDAFLPIPGPWAMTIGSIYLNGGACELNWKALGRLLLIVFAIVIAMLYFIHRRNTNWQLKKKKPGRVIVPMVAISLLLTGCNQRDETIIYNRSASNQYETDAYILVGSYDGSILTDKAQEKTYAFPLNPLEGNIITCGSTFFGAGNTVYYLRFTTHQPKAGWNTVVVNCDLMKLELDTMEESVVYQWNEETDWFFGLLNRSSTEPNSFAVELLFIHGNEMYYADTSMSTLNRMNLNTGKYEVILTEMYSWDVAYDGTNLYYLDSYNRLVIHNLNTGSKRAIDEVVAKDFLLTTDGIYFQNRRDHLAVYFWNDAVTEIKKITEEGP